MLMEKNDSVIKETLKNLCSSNGWSYGILWGFDQRNSLLLTLKDAYFEEKMAALLDNMLLQVHVLGGGVIGQTAFIKNHRWIFADANHGTQNSSGSFEGLDVFQDDSDFYCQFSMGIKTIALISVEPWGVVQLGSTRMIPESTDFVDQVNDGFRDMAKSLRIELSKNEASSSATKSFYPNQHLDSLSSCDINKKSDPETYIEPNQSSVINPSHSHQSFASTSDHQFTNSCFTENQILFHASQSEQLFSDSGNFFEFSSIIQDDCSVLTSSWPHSTFENMLKTSSGLTDPAEFRTQGTSGLLSLDEFEFAEGLSKLCPMDEWFSPRSCSSNTSYTGLIPLSNLNNGHDKSSLDVISQNLPTNSMQSSVTDAFLFNHPEDKCSDASSIDKIFDSLGGKPEYLKRQGWNQTLSPVVDGHDRDSENNTIVGNKVGASNSLFSKLGLDKLLDGRSSSLNKSRFEDQLSCGAKRRKIDNCSWSPHHEKMQSLNSFDKRMKSLDTETSNIMELDGQVSMKKPGSYISGGNSNITAGNTSSSTKRTDEISKLGKKKAKPGTRPRPKDRQMIQDRLAELRHLIPNGEKMSIDRLLERTIRHMNFMQNLTKHSETLKKIDKPKKGDFSNVRAGVTWACEVGNQNMVCPLIVEDLITPGQMLIEMLCEEHGFFLEIVDIIRGFGLIILKGVMEVREAKIWAHFIVEAEGNRRITRHEIFSSLIQLLQMTGQGAATSNHHFLGKVQSSGECLFDNFQPAVPFPANTADTLQGANS